LSDNYLANVVSLAEPIRRRIAQQEELKVRSKAWQEIDQRLHYLANTAGARSDIPAVDADGCHAAGIMDRGCSLIDPGQAARRRREALPFSGDGNAGMNLENISQPAVFPVPMSPRP
jgi:hypothetical protein